MPDIVKLKLQCDSCFSNLEPTKTSTIFHCVGCNLNYFIQLPTPARPTPTKFTGWVGQATYFQVSDFYYNPEPW